jgi:isopenicillin N synthase-like dioxygenase
MNNYALLHAVADHGVPEALIAETFEQQRRFFSLPLEQKMRIAADSNYR